MAELIAARRRIALFVALFLFAAVLLTTQVRSADRRQAGGLGTLVLSALLPLQAGMTRVVDGVAGLWESYTEIGRLRVQNRQLRGQVDALSQEVAALREQAAAAERLQRLLAFRRQAPFHTTAARVISREPSRWFSTVLIDRGSRDGVQPHAPVVTPEGVVGRVIEVTPTAARVLLIADSRSALGVQVQRTRDAGVVEGRSGLLLHMKYLSRAAQVEAGDIILTSGQGGVFPRGLVVGRIVRVVGEPGALLLEAEVEPAVPLDRLEEVLVLIPAL